MPLEIFTSAWPLKDFAVDLAISSSLWWTKDLTSSSKHLMAPFNSTSAGITFVAWPEWIEATVITAWSKAEIYLEIIA